MTEPKTAEVKVVPVEPTHTMQKAGRDAIYDAQERGWAGLDVIDIWKVMLAAAPSHIGEAAGMVAPAQSGSDIIDCATWVPLDDNGLAEVRVNGMRITSMPSYAGAAEVAERIAKALSLTEPFRACQPTAPGSPAEKGEGEPAGWFRRSKANPARGEWYQVDEPEVADLRRVGCVVQPLYTHPASDQSDTERMRAERDTMARTIRSLTDPGIDHTGAKRRLMTLRHKARAALAEKEAGQ